MLHDFTREPEIPAFSMLGYMAVVLGHAEASYRHGAAATAAISDALGRQKPPATIASVCRFAWSVMVEPRSSTTKAEASSAPVGLFTVERRDVERRVLLDQIRAMLGVAREHTAEGEQAAIMGREIPAVVQGVDVSSWFGWCVVGLWLFSGPHPTMLTLRDETRRFAVVLAMLRGRGNLTAAERLTGTTRARVRSMLRRIGCYPWER